MMKRSYDSFRSRTSLNQIDVPFWPSSAVRDRPAWSRYVRLDYTQKPQSNRRWQRWQNEPIVLLTGQYGEYLMKTWRSSHSWLTHVPNLREGRAEEVLLRRRGRFLLIRDYTSPCLRGIFGMIAATLFIYNENNWSNWYYDCTMTRLHC